MEIYNRRDHLAKTNHGAFLPPSWRTLHELARLPDDVLVWAHTHKRITPDLQRKDIAKLRADYDGTASARNGRKRKAPAESDPEPEEDIEKDIDPPQYENALSSLFISRLRCFPRTVSKVIINTGFS